VGEALSRKTARFHLSSSDSRSPLPRLLALQVCACGAFLRFILFSLSPLFLLTLRVGPFGATLAQEMRRRLCRKKDLYLSEAAAMWGVGQENKSILVPCQKKQKQKMSIGRRRLLQHCWYKVSFNISLSTI